jgi:SSS family solute:Na+ symporter
MTQPRKEDELVGLVYSLTPKPKDRDLPWIRRPASLALIVVVLIVGLNLIFL